MEPMRAVIAVLTYRRNDDLAALLPTLAVQAAGVEDAVDLLVVDNDPAGGAREVLESSDSRARYVHEPRPGIAAARNRALDEAAGYDLLVFIDDDERPLGAWLAHHLAQYREGRPFAVVGPVISEFQGPLDPWIEAGRFFNRRRMPSGTTVTMAGTGNMLLDLEQLAGLGLRFDERFSLTGGSDSLFTRQATSRGARIVWCDEAQITDVVPAARLTRQWVIRRAYRYGNSWTRIALEIEPSHGGRARLRCVLAFQGLARVVAGSLRWLLGIVTRSIRHEARGAKTASRGAGLLAGLVGYRYVEYARPTSNG